MIGKVCSYSRRAAILQKDLSVYGRWKDIDWHGLTSHTDMKRERVLVFGEPIECKAFLEAPIKKKGNIISVSLLRGRLSTRLGQEPQRSEVSVSRNPAFSSKRLWLWVLSQLCLRYLARLFELAFCWPWDIFPLQTLYNILYAALLNQPAFFLGGVIAIGFW